MKSLLMGCSERFDESTKWKRENTFPPLGFLSQAEYIPGLCFPISPAEEKVNCFSFVLISYAMKILCVFSPFEKVSANTALRTEHKGWGDCFIFPKSNILPVKARDVDGRINNL